MLASMGATAAICTALFAWTTIPAHAVALVAAVAVLPATMIVGVALGRQRKEASR